MHRPRHVPRWAHELFMRIKEPRSTRLAFFLIYLILGLGGFSSFSAPPRSIETVLGDNMTLFWGGAMIIGGLLGASSVLRGSWWVERAGLMFCATGFAMYAVVVTDQQLASAGAYKMQLAIIATALITLILRWTNIRRGTYDPEQ